MERLDPSPASRPLRRFLGVAPWPIHQLDRRGRPCRPNPALAALLGYSERELDRETLADSIPDETRNRLRDVVRSQGPSIGDSHTELSLTYLHRGGLEIEARRTRIGPLDDPDEPTLVMLEGVEPSRRFDRSQVQSRMSRLIAHDLNNVFTVAQSYLDLADREDPSSRLSEQYLERALRAIQRGIRVTRQLQTIVVEKPFPTEETYLQEVVGDLEPFLSRLLPFAPQWTVDCESPLPPVMSHPALLGRFVIDVAINALLRWPHSEHQCLEVHRARGDDPALLLRIRPEAESGAQPTPFRLFLCQSASPGDEDIDPLWVSDILAHHSISVHADDRAVTALLPLDKELH